MAIYKPALFATALFLAAPLFSHAQNASPEVQEICADLNGIMSRVAELDGASGVREFEAKAPDTVDMCKAAGLYQSPIASDDGVISNAEGRIAELEAENRRLCLETTELIAELFPLGGISSVIEAEEQNASLIQSCTEEGLYQRPEKMRSFEASCRELKSDIADVWYQMSASQKSDYRTQASSLTGPCSQLGVRLFPSG